MNNHDSESTSTVRRLGVKALFACALLALLLAVLLYKICYLLNAPVHAYLAAYTVLTSVFLLSRFLLAAFYYDDHSKSPYSKEYPSVTFVIACKNEEKSIARTIEACLDSDYPAPMECIAVDDGSTDGTLRQMVLSRQKHGSKLKVISFSHNKGKREAMAEGVLAASGSIIVFVDSDSFVQRDAVRHLVQHFIYDKKVGGVSGNTLVENAGVNALTKMQSARYGVSFNLFKASESVFGTVTCCPGCFSAYRKEAILKVLGQWRSQSFLGSKSTFGDDRSLTNYVLRSWKVIYCRKAVATTIVPEKYGIFFRQQLRWKKSWIREGAVASRFMWRKHPIAAASFYTGLTLPIIGPLILARVFILAFIAHGVTMIIYLLGASVMSLMFGLYYHLIEPNRYWWYVLLFTMLYTFVLIWQMPYAVLKLKDTRWGTR